MNNPQNIIKELNELLSAKVNHLKQELQGIRGNRPSPELLEHVRANYHEQSLTIQQLASLSVRLPRDIILQTWDSASIPSIMKAIEDAKLGVSVARDENAIRVSIPALTSERKAQLNKIIGKIIRVCYFVSIFYFSVLLVSPYCPALIIA